MSRKGLILLTLSLLLSLSLAPSPSRAWQLDGLHGGQLEEADFARGVTLVVVWAPWSPRCEDIVPRIRDLNMEWSTRARLISVLFQGPSEEIDAYLDRRDLDPPIFLDRTGAFARAHEVSTLPGLLVFEAGELIYRGRLSSNPGPAIEKALDQG